jgi:hypothetical protein
MVGGGLRRRFYFSIKLRRIYAELDAATPLSLLQYLIMMAHTVFSFSR